MRLLDQGSMSMPLHQGHKKTDLCSESTGWGGSSGDSRFTAGQGKIAPHNVYRSNQTSLHLGKVHEPPDYTLVTTFVH